MVSVFLGLGSNVDRARNIQLAISALTSKFGALQCSALYESHAINQKGGDYYNAVVRFETDIPLQKILDDVKQIENILGRDRTQSEKVSIDIDLLLFGGVVSFDAEQKIPHPDILLYPHVLVPLSEIAAEFVHPVVDEKIKNICIPLRETELKMIGTLN